MSQEQTSNSQTNADSQTPVSFADVSLTTLKSSFNDTYKVSKGSSSQVVLGFQAMKQRLQEPTNEYQQVIYPKIRELCERLSTKYVETFLTTFASDVERQVYGANLNGNRNNGSLYRAIPSGVNRNLTYNYALFGQLSRVLTSRLRFIVQRDPTSVQRYRDSVEESNAYQKLQASAASFLTFLETVNTEWNTLVSETRTKLSPSDGQQRQRFQQNRQPHEQHQPREQRPQYGVQRPQYGEQRQHRVQRPQYGEQRQSRQDTEQGNTRQTQRSQYKQVRRNNQNSDDNGSWTTPRVSVRNTKTTLRSGVTI